nr:hypothetical protein [Tanacetum cinerariifolium]GEZ08068.1 hypothetical protein [Tanacetum cinerariifolium]
IHPERNVTMGFFLKLAVHCTVNRGSVTADERNVLASFFRTLADRFSNMVLPPEVDKIHVHMFLKHLAIALVINDLDSYKRADPRYSSPCSKSQVSYDLAAHLEEWILLIYNRYLNLDIFFFDQLSTLLLSNELIDAREDCFDPIKLSTIPDFLDRFIEDFSTYCGSERNESIENKHIQVAAKVGVAYFTLLLTTKEDMKILDDAFTKLKKENRFKPKLLEYLTHNLEGVIKAFEGNGRINEVIESSKLCCTLQWERVSSFCKMLKLTKDEVSSGFSEYAIVDLVTKASQDSASLLSLFNKHCTAELNTILIELVGRWLDAKNIFDIPSPVALVHQWVDIQYEQTQRSTIYSLVQSLRTSNQSGGIILEQELNEYRKIKDCSPELCKEMEMLIENTISETNRRLYGLSRSDTLIKCGARLASCGPISCQSDSITYLDQAISILVNLEDTNKKVTGEQVLPLLIKAYCYKALFKRIVHPSSKEFTEDIKNALKAWDHRSASHDKLKLHDNDIDLFFHVADLLALEGYRELNSKLYKMMIKRVKLAENRKLSDFLEMAWKSGSLSHALCASPVDVLIIKEMEDTNVQFWINCGKTQEQKAGIKQCLSVIPTLSSDDLRDDAHAQEAQKTIYEVKEAVSTLINEESHSFDSFGAARLHYDLAERFITKGLFIEALSHATKSYLLRDKHLSECFDIEWHRGKANIVGQADTKITKYDCPRFNMNPSSISPFAYSGPQTYPTPWSTVRCYLESSLQTGIVQEKIGNGDEAEIFFLRGQKIATVLHLPMFIARFSRALGMDMSFT